MRAGIHCRLMLVGLAGVLALTLGMSVPVLRGPAPGALAAEYDGLSNVAAIAAGQFHTCALLGGDDVGTVKCWGANYAGQLGNGSAGAYSTTPVAVCDTGATAPCTGTAANGNILTGAIAIAAGGSHTCALLGDGTVKCWGANDSGQLGNGTWTNSSTPVAVCPPGATAPCTGTAANGNILTGAFAIAAGYDDTCALLGDRNAWCWGSNRDGQLGNGQMPPHGLVYSSTTPVLVHVDDAGVAITAGYYHNCALLGDGTVACWGNNRYGQLGDGTLTRDYPYFVCATGDSGVGLRVPHWRQRHRRRGIPHLRLVRRHRQVLGRQRQRPVGGRYDGGAR